MIRERDITKYLRSNIQPVSDIYSKNAYRAAAFLNDGTYLPCVIFRNKNDILDLAKERFKELMDTQYRNDIIETFVISGSSVAYYDLKKIEISPFSFPSRLRNIIYSAGETKMGYVSFQAVMDDGKQFYFESTTHVEFFEIPDGYNLDRIKSVYPHKFSGNDSFREKPYFDCFTNEL